jgi:hypothetical protein
MRERSWLTEMLIGRRVAPRVSVRSWLKEKLIVWGTLWVCGCLTLLIMYLLGKL